jgi:uncharacterized protein RhaS with RHS repeats
MKHLIYLIFFIITLSIKAQVTVTYTYDNLNRLTQASYSNGVGIQYSYDVMGNRTQEVKTNNTISVEENENPLQINVYPNPFVNELMIRLQENTLTKVLLFDEQGKVVLEQKQDSQTAQMNVNHLSSGIYFLEVQTDKGTQTFKVVKKE